MPFDTTLNLVWLSLGVVALAAAIRVACRCEERGETRRSRWPHFVGVALIITALFPYISATDDVLRIEHFQAQQGPHHSSKQTANDDLMRLYAVVDSPLVCRIVAFALVFFFIFIVLAKVALSIDEIAPSYAGRSPPGF